MANNRLEFLENSYYHIYNRGFNKELIFIEKSDYAKFYKYIVKILKEYPEIKMSSYCFLPNHFHLVIQNKKTGHFISEFMRKLQVSYAMYFKTKYKEKKYVIKGQAFFEGRFKSKFINSDEYLQQCLAYVNFNPLKHGLVKDINDYPYTSYHQILKRGIKKFEQYKGQDLLELDY